MGAAKFLKQKILLKTKQKTVFLQRKNHHTMHTTNYYNTFIEVAEDCPAQTGEVPETKNDKRSVANQHFDMIAQHPYKFTSDEVIFSTYAERNGITGNLEHERSLFFSKGQACLRASPLGKRYGWGIHHDGEGKVAVVALGSDEYATLQKDTTLKHVKAMRTKKA
jgi:hypothetical protein